MHKTVFAIRNAIASMNVSEQERRDILNYTISTALATSLALPSGPVENPYNYFSENHTVPVNEMVSAINEEMQIDARAVADNVKKMWLVRYRMVHDARAQEQVALFNAVLICNEGVTERSSEIASTIGKKEIFFQLNHMVQQLREEIQGKVEPTNT